jgi:hypothetical protein
VGTAIARQRFPAKLMSAVLAADLLALLVIQVLI